MSATAPPATALLGLVGHIGVIDLSQSMFNGMPQSPNHPEFRLALTRRHGDVVRADGGSAAAELIVTGGHVGTHVDALAHVSHCGELYGGVPAADAQQGGRFSTHGVDQIDPMVCRGVLLDVAAARGEEVCPPGYEVTPADLAAAAAHAGLQPAPGDVILVRTGWGAYWDDAVRFVGRDTGVPGPGEPAARWLAEHRPRAVGGETLAFEQIPAGAGHALLPAHRLLLVERGIHIIETLALAELAAAGVHEFCFVMAPLRLLGATGSPVRPLALVLRD